jgi:hypothetical protein
VTTYLIPLAVLLAGLFYLPFFTARRGARRHHARIRKASTAELVEEARRGIRSEHWQRFPAGKMLMVEDVQSDEGLRDALQKLWAEVTQEDREKNQHGRDSNYFEFYDSGLVAIEEVLAERLKTGRRAGPLR